MDRVIKFRAWDKKYNIMLDPEAFNRNDVWISGDGKVYEIEEWSGYGGGGKTEEDCSDQYILMQYTGSKSKDGSEVYDRDILRLGDQRYVVVYENGVFASEWVHPTRSKVLLYHHVGDAEIIGNIYQNPELLNG